MKVLRVALLQCQSRPGDVEGNLARLDQACRRAARSGAQLLVTPEMFLSGYNIGGAAAIALAEPNDGARLACVATIAQRHGMAIVMGYPASDGSGAVWNAALCIDAQGRRVGACRKSRLYGDLDRGMFSAGPGNDGVFDCLGWKIGLLICYDVEFPETTRRLALEGADLIVVLTANMDGFDFVQQHLLPTRAYENQVFVAYANFCGHEAGLAYNGRSGVAGPEGVWLAQARRRPTLLLADLARQQLDAARLRLRHLDDARAFAAPTAPTALVKS